MHQTAGQAGCPAQVTFRRCHIACGIAVTGLAAEQDNLGPIQIAYFSRYPQTGQDRTHPGKQLLGLRQVPFMGSTFCHSYYDPDQAA